MRKREFALLVGPSMLVMFGLLVVPLYRTIQWSFQEVQYGAPGVFFGLQNYAAALTDPRFGRAVLFTVVLTLVVTAALLVLGYVIATLVNQLGKLRPVVLGILFTIWHLLPFSMLIILAGLQGVPDEIIEAAKIDGATSLKSHLFVIVPTIRGVLFFVTLISIMDVLRTFDQLIPLAPQAVEIGNESIMLYIYNIAFREGSERLGLGSAVSVLTILLILLMLTPFIRDTFSESRALR